MIGVALGQIGASLQDLLNWECDDYVNAVKYHRLKQKETWEMIRWNSFYSLVAMNGTDKITIDKVILPVDTQTQSFNDKKRAKWRKLR